MMLKNTQVYNMSIAFLGGVIEMIGRQPVGQDHLFYAFNLESVVPQKHLLRSIARCLDLTDLRQHLAEYYSHTGRPSIDPELMIRMLVVGYCYGKPARLRKLSRKSTVLPEYGDAQNCPEHP